MNQLKTDIAVVGAGPGGYTAAFYAADKGKNVVLVEREDRLGGICLLHGCIPSKALLHTTQVIRETKACEARGVHFNPPKIDVNGLRDWKDAVLNRLAQGLGRLARKRGVQILNGRGYFEDSKTLRVETKEGQKFVSYNQAIVAVGSKPSLPKIFDLGNPRVMTSTEALKLEDIPKDILIVGGGYIGMELGTVYATLGSAVVLVEALGSMLVEIDSDLVRPVAQTAERIFKEMRFNTRISKLATSGKRIKATMEAEGEMREELYDRVLVSIGRVPNCDDLGLENTKITRDEKGFIKVNSKQETSDPSIYAIGDAAGGPLLAHKASKEARIAVEVLTGESSVFEGIVIPAVVFTDPEIAWCGLTEKQAGEKKQKIRVMKFPWSASGRALSVDRPDGLTKLLIDPDTERVLGAGIVGYGAGELISEAVLAIEMGATAKDMAETIHPHPTLSETLMEDAENFYGTATHVTAPPNRASDNSY